MFIYIYIYRERERERNLSFLIRCLGTASQCQENDAATPRVLGMKTHVFFNQMARSHPA